MRNFTIKNFVLIVIGALVLLLSGTTFAQDVDSVGGVFSRAEQNLTVNQDIPQDRSVRLNYKTNAPLNATLSYVISDAADLVNDDFDFKGLSVYLGFAPAFEISEAGKIKYLKFKKEDALTSTGTITGFKGRFEAIWVKAPGATVSVTQEGLKVDWPAGSVVDLTVLTGHPDVSTPPKLADDFDIRRLQYSHLPRWLAALCRIVEKIYKTIQGVTGLGWGLSLIVFAVVIKLLMLPFSLLTNRFQSQVSEHQTALEPILADIKKNYKGEKAHNKTMAAYKARSITPFYTLKPMLATLVSLPILIAIFNMLGEVDVLKDAPFMWFDSLGYPDRVASLPFSLPLMGNYLNTMPFFMTFVTLFSTITHQNSKATPAELKKQRRNLYFMTAAFFFIFYTFPAGMVFYWALVNLLQWCVSRVFKI